MGVSPDVCPILNIYEQRLKLDSMRVCDAVEAVVGQGVLRLEVSRYPEAPAVLFLQVFSLCRSQCDIAGNAMSHTVSSSGGTRGVIVCKQSLGLVAVPVVPQQFAAYDSMQASA